jgi:hypothetical protein
MIPYEELVAALSRWRARRGLPTGLGDALSDPAGRGSFDHSRDAEVELGDEQIEGMVDAQEGEVAGDRAVADSELVGDRDSMMEFGALSDEATKPAGLAGLVPPSGAPQAEYPLHRLGDGAGDLADADAATTIGPDPAAADPSDAAEPKPKRRGGRRRRK